MKKTKIISVAASLVLSLSFAVGCAKNDGNANKAHNVTKDYTETYASGSLHKVNVTYGTRKFVVNGQSDYRLVVGSDSKASEAVSFIIKHVNAATGKKLSSVSDSEVTTVSKSDKYIVIGSEALFEKAGLTMPEDDLKKSGYYIKSYGDSVFLATGYSFGYQTAALKFLELTIGYDCYAADCFSYDKDGSVLPDMDIIERPDFDFRHWSNPTTAVTSTAYAMGYTPESDDFVPAPNPPDPTIGGTTVHNVFGWLNPEIYTEHKDYWYSNNGEQLCYTAHGNGEERKAMIETMAENILAQLPLYPGRSVVSISQQDTKDSLCTCDSCREYLEKYADYEFGANNPNCLSIPFLNEVEKIVNARAGRTITIVQFAYHDTLVAPVKKENGEWVPIDETVKCNDHVGVQIAPIEAYFTKTFEDEANAYYAEKIAQWGGITHDICYWLYETNFRAYLIPFNSWSSMVDHYRYAYKFSDTYMFNEGQLGQNVSNGFTALKDYIDAKAMFNVNVNVEEVIEKFFKGYFKAAGDVMLAYFKDLQLYLTELEVKYPDIFDGNCSQAAVEDELYWEEGTMQKYLEYIDRAYAVIAETYAEDSALSAALNVRVNLESIFPRYILCQYYANNYGEAKKAEMRESFKADCTSLGITRHWEHSEISGLWNSWGL